MIRRSAHTIVFAVGLAFGAALVTSQTVLADEGGVSFWIPGFYGSLAAVPPQPGWSVVTIYYHTSVRAGGDVTFARQVNRGGITTNFSGNLAFNLDLDADLAIVIPTYSFSRPVLGGRLSVSLMGIAGREQAAVDATLTGVGPLGLVSISRGRSDDATGSSDLFPQATLSWNCGVNNYMTYITGDIPVGNYDPTRLANLGIGHGAVDAGVGYTYFNQQTGNEFSAVLGFTYNLENQQTDYKNGVDMHLDWGASKFLTKQLQVGLVGYFYEQISPDSGSGDRVGSFESRVIGIGPQLGFIFRAGMVRLRELSLKQNHAPKRLGIAAAQQELIIACAGMSSPRRASSRRPKPKDATSLSWHRMDEEALRDCYSAVRPCGLSIVVRSQS